MSTLLARATSADSALRTFTPLPAAGIKSPLDALLTVPAAYVDATTPIDNLATAKDRLAERHPMVFCALVITGVSGFDSDNRAVADSSLFSKRTVRLEIDCRDVQGRPCVLKAYGGIWGWRGVHVGATERLMIKNIDWTRDKPVLSGTRLASMEHITQGGITPLFAGTAGVVSGDKVTECVHRAVQLARVKPELWTAAREQILRESACTEEALLATANVDFGTVVELLRALHVPASYSMGLRAIRAATHLAAAAVSHRARSTFLGRRPAQSCSIVGIKQAAQAAVDQLAARGIALTGGQLRCIASLASAMAGDEPSATLLNGDVGTGKTLAFLVPATAAFACGKNVAVMAPNSLLADQIYANALRFFPDLVATRVETGRKFPKVRALLIGTAGMATVCRLARWTPDVLVIDEQHKLSAAQRENLVAEHTHLIEATATPIPRSLAIAQYGGIDQLILDECPVKRDVFSAAVYGAGARAQVGRVAGHVIDSGGIAAFVYPSVHLTEADDESEDAPQREKGVLLSAYARLSERWPNQVARLYGDMSDDEKRSEVEALRRGEKKILVASSLIEVGTDIPALGFLAVIGADRFGISQLHQLRGRLARNGGVGYFMMFVPKERHLVDQSTAARMAIVAETNDGFKLADADLKNRGFGDVAGDKQSGGGHRVLRGVTLKARHFLALKIGPQGEMPGAGAADIACAGIGTEQEDDEVENSSDNAVQPSLF